MNLLPITEKEKIIKGLKQRTIVLALFAVTISFVFGFVILIPSYFLVENNFSKIKSENMTLGNNNEKEQNEMIGLPEEIESKLPVLENVIYQKNIQSILNEIIDLKNDKIKITSLSFSRDASFGGEKGIVVIVSGVSQDRLSLASFSNNLKESKNFTNINVPVSSLAKDKNLPFTINIFIKK